MPDTNRKKLKLRLVGLNGNAWSLMGAFQRQATNEGWPLDEINSVLNKAKSGDYDHLVRTLSKHCVNGGA